jgi:hypothetical protein
MKEERLFTTVRQVNLRVLYCKKMPLKDISQKQGYLWVGEERKRLASCIKNEWELKEK